MGAVAVMTRRAVIRLRYGPGHCPHCDRKNADDAVVKALVKATRDHVTVEAGETKRTGCEPFRSDAQRGEFLRTQLASALRTNASKRSRFIESLPRKTAVNVLVWVDRSPRQYDWRRLCFVGPRLETFAMSYGWAFAPNAAVRRSCVNDAKLPCGIVEVPESRRYFDCREAGMRFDVFGLDLSAAEFDALDLIYFPFPYVGVVGIAKHAAYDWEASTLLLPPRGPRAKWLLENLEEPAADYPAAADERFRVKFDLTVGHTSLSDVVDRPARARLASLGGGEQWKRSNLEDDDDDEFWTPRRRILASTAFAKDDNGDCETNSRRDTLVAFLEQAGLPITHFGPCPRRRGSSSMPSSMRPTPSSSSSARQLRLDAGRVSKFALVIEASTCLHYVTDALYDALDAGAVPVYRGAPDAKRSAFLPNTEAAIFVDDFASLQDLVAHLLNVANDKEAYLRYHAWRLAPFDEAFLRADRSNNHGGWAHRERDAEPSGRDDDTLGRLCNLLSH
mmetsp:Transcript_32948/g.105112  ORF Transcript_32948/g.105112 Transcript_32948/m.105112 type:complete len:505 (-) Transcript_32948:1269-2783(-)